MIEPYDMMKDDFALILNKEDAKYCILKYGKYLSAKYLPKMYLYLIKELNQ